MKGAQLSEEKTAAASYILNFYSEVVQLTHNYANFENVLLELKSKYMNNTEAITLEEKELVKQQSNILRYYTTKTYISYISIVGGLKEVKLNPKISEGYTKIKDQQVIRTEDIKDYVINLNEFIVNAVIKNLLESSQELLTNIYDKEDQTKEE